MEIELITTVIIKIDRLVINLKRNEESSIMFYRTDRYCNEIEIRV